MSEQGQRHFEIPKEMRSMADAGLDQARRTFEKFIEGAQVASIAGMLALLFETIAAPAIVTRLVLLCYKRRAQQKGHCGSWVRRKRAILLRRVAIEAGLCRSARARRTAGLEVGRKLRGA